MKAEIVVHLGEGEVDSLRSLLAWAQACGTPEEVIQAAEWRSYFGSRWDHLMTQPGAFDTEGNAFVLLSPEDTLAAMRRHEAAA
jgi:hypothetical protein